jgi:hypothetical protein
MSRPDFSMRMRDASTLVGRYTSVSEKSIAFPIFLTAIGLTGLLLRKRNNPFIPWIRVQKAGRILSTLA